MRLLAGLVYGVVFVSACTGNGEFDLGTPDATVDARVPDARVGTMDSAAPDAQDTSDAGRDASVADADRDARIVGTSGCGQAAGASNGEVTFTHEGRERRYLLYLPANHAPDKPTPLLFALHGNGGSVNYWNSTDGTNDRNIRGEVENDAILVIAEAIEGNWRDYGADRSTWPARIEEELGYFDAIVEDLSNKLCIDRRAIFSMGFSGGGSFSGVLGCRRAYIRAIAAGGSVIYFDPDDCVQAPAAWVTMGQMELDTRGTAFRDHFLGAAGCSSESSATDPSPCVAYQGCAADAPQNYCVHPGDHVWPDFGTTAAWAFFRQFAQ